MALTTAELLVRVGELDTELNQAKNLVIMHKQIQVILAQEKVALQNQVDRLIAQLETANNDTPEEIADRNSILVLLNKMMTTTGEIQALVEAVPETPVPAFLAKQV